MCLAQKSSCVSARTAVRPAATVRPVRMVVRAQAGDSKNVVQQLVKPAVTAVVANVLLALPAAADVSGDVFLF